MSQLLAYLEALYEQSGQFPDGMSDEEWLEIITVQTGTELRAYVLKREAAAGRKRKATKKYYEELDSRSESRPIMEARKRGLARGLDVLLGDNFDGAETLNQLVLRHMDQRTGIQPRSTLP
jgi:hypothetical protein